MSAGKSRPMPHGHAPATGTPVDIRTYRQGDAVHVRDLFVTAMREMVPDHLTPALDTYVAQARLVELDRVEAYYAEHHGGFWVACRGDRIVGMVGIEGSGDNTMELRRMIVATGERRQGIGTSLLRFAEAECRRRGAVRLVLSTSELQPAALALYEGAGFELIRTEVADAGSSKTLGAGLRRFHLGKRLL